MSTTIMVLADVHGLMGRRSELEEILAALTLESRRELGCESFRVLPAEDPADFVLLSRWSDEAALRTHYTTSHYRRYREAVGPLLARPSDVTVFHLHGAIDAIDPNPADPTRLG
jgi:quinol monooxygenase YgiN